MKSSELSMSVAISKHEREGLSGISTNSDSKRSCNPPPGEWAGHEEHCIEREDEREHEQRAAARRSPGKGRPPVGAYSRLSTE